MRGITPPVWLERVVRAAVRRARTALLIQEGRETAWIEVHQSLPTHRKTLAAADALGIEPVRLVGHLCCLWMWTLDNSTPEGMLSTSVTPRTIARAALWAKDCDDFVEALVGAGFLERSAAGMAVHDWPEYAGRLMERRQRDADRKRVARTSDGRTPDIRETSAGRPTSRARAIPDPTGPRSGPLTNTLLARARAREEPAAPRALADVQGDGPPTRLPNGAQQCPLCPEVFSCTYAEHLESSPRHKVRASPEDFSKQQAADAEVLAEVAPVAARKPLGPEDLPPALRAEHERLQQREREHHARNGTDVEP